MIGEEEPTQHLLPLLVDRDENVVVSTVEALGNMKSVRSLPFLFEAYDRDDYTRPAVAEALGKIGDPSASGFLMDRLRQSLLTVSTDPVTPFAIIEALGSLGGDGVLAVLESVVTQVKGRLRSTVLLAITRISERQRRPLPTLTGLRADFLNALAEDDVSVQMSAVKWLAGIQGEDVTGAMVRRLGLSPDLDALLTAELIGRPDTFRLCLEIASHTATRPAQGRRRAYRSPDDGDHSSGHGRRDLPSSTSRSLPADLMRWQRSGRVATRRRGRQWWMCCSTWMETGQWISWTLS